jgi:hypothetical protein
MAPNRHSSRETVQNALLWGCGVVAPVLLNAAHIHVELKELRRLTNWKSTCAPSQSRAKPAFATIPD